MSRGTVTRRGKSSWRIKYDVPGNAPGQRVTKYLTVRGTKAQAQREAAKIMASLATGTHVDPSAETVAAFVERWLADWADDNVSNKTWTRYAQLLRKHLCARVGFVPTTEATRRRPASSLCRDGKGRALPIAPGCICTGS